MELLRFGKVKFLYVVLTSISILTVSLNYLLSARSEESGSVGVTGRSYNQSLEMEAAETKLIKEVIPRGRIESDIPIFTLGFSLDGKMIITGAETGALELWDAENDFSLIYVLEGHTKEIFGLALSGDGKYLATGGGDQLIKIWDLSGRKLFKTIRVNTDSITALAFSPDNTILASASLGNEIELWAAKNGEFYRVTTLKNPHPSVYSLSFYPDSTYLVSAGRDKEIRVWPVGVDDQTKVFKEHLHIVLKAAFSPKGGFLASGGADNVVYMWKIFSRTGRLEFQEKPFFSYVHRGWVTKVGFSPDEKFFITASQDGLLRVWDLASRRPVKMVPVFSNQPIYDFVFSPQGDYLAVSVKTGGVFVYDWNDIISGGQGQDLDKDATEEPWVE